MQRLWREEGIPARSHVLQISTYEKLGRARGIIQGHVDRCMSKLSQRKRDMAARILHQLLISARPARIDELVRHANDSQRDWQPSFREKEVKQLITGHLERVAHSPSLGQWRIRDLHSWANSASWRLGSAAIAP